MAVYAPSMHCLFHLASLAAQLGVSRGIVRGAYTARDALIEQLADSMLELGLTVPDMLILATWGSMAPPQALDPVTVAPI